MTSQSDDIKQRDQDELRWHDEQNQLHRASKSEERTNIAERATERPRDE